MSFHQDETSSFDATKYSRRSELHLSKKDCRADPRFLPFHGRAENETLSSNAGDSTRGPLTVPSCDDEIDVLKPKKEPKQEQHEQTILAHFNNSNFNEIIAWVKNNPEHAAEPIQDGSKKTTTILHKILTSKLIDNTKRFSLFSEILEINRKSAAVRNHHGSLPLHVVVRNNAKVDGETKRLMISALIKIYPEALTAVDTMQHTPLHVACEKWCTSNEARILVDAAREAAAMKDGKGYLPIHITCSRRCSPEKLQILLDAYPEGINAVTDDGETPLSIAQKTATDAHPNSVLIQTLKDKLKNSEGRKHRDRVECPGIPEIHDQNEEDGQPMQKNSPHIPDLTTSSSHVPMRPRFDHDRLGNSAGQDVVQSGSAFHATGDFRGDSTCWDDVARLYALNYSNYQPYGHHVLGEDVAHFHDGDMLSLAAKAQEVFKQLQRGNDLSLTLATRLEEEHHAIISAMCRRHDLLEAQRQRIELANDRLLLRIQELKRIIDYGRLL